VSWLDDGADDDELEFDESSVRVRPNPKANRPRTKRRPAHADAQIARVLGVDRGRYTVLVDEDGPEERRVLATRARELRKQPIVNGDRARVVGDLSGAEGTLGRIVGIEERTSLLRRSADDTDQVERVIVANADQMLIVVAAADPEPRERLVDRYLVAALDAGIRPLLVVTKTDLADPSEFLSHFEGVDLRVFRSGHEDMPLERIGAALAGHSTVFVGHSGVGKSTTLRTSAMALSSVIACFVATTIGAPAAVPAATMPRPMPVAFWLTSFSFCVLRLACATFSSWAVC
jgi:ribosome biogenesis GTPase